MTTPQKIVRLPPPTPPLLNRVISNPLFNEQTEAITWKLGDEHPLASGWEIIRMFVDHGGVEIYSIPSGGKSGHYTRNLIPMATVRFTEEVMPIDVFAEELTAAENDEDDDDEDDEPEPVEVPVTSDSNVAPS